MFYLNIFKEITETMVKIKRKLWQCDNNGSTNKKFSKDIEVITNKQIKILE